MKSIKMSNSNINLGESTIEFISDNKDNEVYVSIEQETPVFSDICSYSLTQEDVERLIDFLNSTLVKNAIKTIENKK